MNSLGFPDVNEYFSDALFVFPGKREKKFRNELNLQLNYYVWLRASGWLIGIVIFLEKIDAILQETIDWVLVKSEKLLWNLNRQKSPQKICFN